MENKSGHGGRRRGAGQKPGGAVVRAAAIELAQVARGYEDNLDEVLAKQDEVGLDTEERKQAYVGLTLRGYSNARATERLGVHDQLGWYYRRQPWFQEQIKEGLSVLQSNRLAIFGPMLPQAMRVYEYHLDDMNERIAENVFDEVLGKPIAHETPRAPVSITIVLRDTDSADTRVGIGDIIEGEVREVEASGKETSLP